MNGGTLGEGNTYHVSENAVLKESKSHGNCTPDNYQAGQLTSISQNGTLTSTEKDPSNGKQRMMMNLVMTGANEDRTENCENKKMNEDNDKSFHHNNNNGNIHGNAVKTRLSPNSCLEGKANVAANAPFSGQPGQFNGVFPFGLDMQQQQQFIHSLKSASLAGTAEESSGNPSAANANATQVAAQAIFAQMLNAAAVTMPMNPSAIHSLFGNSVMAGAQAGDMNNPWNQLLTQLMTAAAAGQQQQQQQQLLLQAGLAQQLQQNVSYSYDSSSCHVSDKKCFYQIPGLANTLGANPLANSMFMGQTQLEGLKQSQMGSPENQSTQNFLNPLLPLLGSGQFGQNLQQQLQAQFLLNNQVGSRGYFNM